MNYSDEEFVSTYHRYVDMIYRLCFSFLKNKEDTEDAVQSVFVKYLNCGKRFENEGHEKAWFIVTASNLCKDMLRQIQGAMEARERKRFVENLRRFAIGFAVVALFLLGSFGTVYAASPVFREYIHSLLFPLYAPDEMISIENGHMTGSFDVVDVLLSFLDKFNRNDFGNEITALKEDGYHYRLFAQDEDRILAFVDSNMVGECIAVYMERIAYESTEGIWQVTGYQILEKSMAEDMQKQLEPYSGQL